MEEITLLNCPTLTRSQIGHLQENKIITLMDLISAPVDLVVTSLEIEDEAYRRLRQIVLKYLQPYPVTLRELAGPENRSAKRTGIPNLDNFLGGGLFPGDVIELYGKTGTGKTQLSMYLTSRICRWGKGNCSVLYFDLKNDFSPNRLLDFCDGDDTHLDNVLVFRLPNLQRLLFRLDDIRREFVGGINGFYSRCKLLVVDSVPMTIYPAVGSDRYSWRYFPEILIEKLEWLANHMKLTVVLINQAVNIRTPISPSASKVKAALGQYWQHRIKIRIQLSDVTLLSDSSSYYAAYLEKCSRGPSGKTFYYCIKTNTITVFNAKPR